MPRRRLSRAGSAFTLFGDTKRGRQTLNGGTQPANGAIRCTLSQQMSTVGVPGEATW